MKKTFFSKAAVVLTLVCTLMTPLNTLAATNNNASVDKWKGKDNEAIVVVPSKRTELTIGEGGKYDLILALPQAAKDFGFSVVDDNTIKLEVSKKVNKKGYVEYPVTWSAVKSEYASVDGDGTVNAKRVCKVKTTGKDKGKYYAAPVVASIPDMIFVNADGDSMTFVDGNVYQADITVVPQEDLLVYYLGVWSEDLSDTNAQHVKDYNNNSSNVKTNLRLMAQNSTEHCYTTTSTLTAVTKTNDGTVRAYLKTTDSKAGNHYYVLAFRNNDGANTIKVQSRDYCDTSYATMGSYTRN